jgi:hypothetical protein
LAVWSAASAGEPGEMAASKANIAKTVTISKNLLIILILLVSGFEGT